MKTNQKVEIYRYLQEHGEATYGELNEKLFMRKSDMRISEINHSYKEKNKTDEDLIVTVRKKKNGEHVKALKDHKPKRVYKYEFDAERGCMIERVVLLT